MSDFQAKTEAKTGVEWAREEASKQKIWNSEAERVAETMQEQFLALGLNTLIRVEPKRATIAFRLSNLAEAIEKKSQKVKVQCKVKNMILIIAISQVSD